MSQFFPRRCKRKQRGEHKRLLFFFKKQNKAIRPDLRAEGCFLRCCRSLVFFCCCCCVLALTALRQLSPPLPAKKNSPELLRLGPRLSSQVIFRSLSHPTNINKLFYENCTAKRDKNRHKNRLDIYIFC